MIRAKNRKASIRIYIIPFVIVTLFASIILMVMTNNIKNNFYEIKKEEGHKIARSVSTILSHGIEASTTILELLEDKLENSLKVAQAYSGNYSDEILIELADTLGLDEMYVYNSEGVIEYSNSDKYIGWKPAWNHPVYAFKNGRDDIEIDRIRQGSDSELFYKYGYIKNSDGTMVQIGILAEKVNQLFESTSIQNILDDMARDSSIIRLDALDSSYLITASSDEDLIGYQLNSEEIISDVKNGKIHGRINSIGGEDIYEIFVPFDYEDNNISAFGIQYSLREIQPLIRRNTLNTIYGLVIVYLALILSIIASYKRDKKLVQVAYFDTLTGLPNTESLVNRLNENKYRKNNAIFMIKCANINLINQAYGYEYGDKVLKELGDKIRTIESKDIKLFRFTDDKLVLYLQNYEDEEELFFILKKMEDVLHQPFRINNISQQIIIRIGVIKFNEISQETIDQLLKKATIALGYTDMHKNFNYNFYNEDMESAINREEKIERELRVAINKEDTSIVYLAYQPIVDTKTSEIDGFEALARMSSEELGHVSPAEFIEIAERKQLIIPLSKLILKVACTFIADLTKVGYNNLSVAVNISSIHLIQEDFVNTVLKILEETGANSNQLELELTETIMVENFQLANDRLKELRSNGIRISLDDFGTGYSSFDRLSELSVDTLKIDRHFINNITETRNVSYLTKEIISIAHILGLKTVAEGVESDAQRSYLEENNCDKLQGYLFSKAIPKEEVFILLKKYNGIK